jgi:hypothetical protein
METGVTSLTTSRVPVGTQPAASLHKRSVAEGVVGTTVTCMTSSVVEMPMVGSKTGVESESAWNRNIAMRATMIIMVHTTTNHTGNAPLMEGITQEESKLSLAT